MTSWRKVLSWEETEPEILKNIRSPEDKEGIVARCGDNITADGLQCPYCECYETYKDANDPNNINKWYFMIRAFRVDNSSKCNNCGEWFDA